MAEISWASCPKYKDGTPIKHWLRSYWVKGTGTPWVVRSKLRTWMNNHLGLWFIRGRKESK